VFDWKSDAEKCHVPLMLSPCAAGNAAAQATAQASLEANLVVMSNPLSSRLKHPEGANGMPW
jgi:hypothetical protein